MSDCSTQAMKSKEPKVLCTGCAETRKRERIAQVAQEMFHEYRELMKDYLWDNGASSSATKQRRLIVMFHDRLEECGVSVDD